MQVETKTIPFHMSDAALRTSQSLVSLGLWIQKVTRLMSNFKILSSYGAARVFFIITIL